MADECEDIFVEDLNGAIVGRIRTEDGKKVFRSLGGIEYTAEELRKLAELVEQ